MVSILVLFEGTVPTGHAVIDTPNHRKLRFWWAVYGGDCPFNVYRSPNAEIALKALSGIDVSHKMEPVLFYDPDDEVVGDLAYWTPHTGWRKVPYNWMDTYPLHKIRFLDEEQLINYQNIIT